MAIDDFNPDNAERSIWHGQPIRCYEFHRTSNGNDSFFRYCTSDRDIAIPVDPDADPVVNVTYTAIPISDEGISQTGEAQSSDISVSMPVVNGFVEMFRTGGVLPSESVFLTIRTVEYAEQIIDDEVVPWLGRPYVVWVGTVGAISQINEVAVKVACSTLAASFKRGGLRLGYERTCPHFLYDGQCRANREDFKLVGPAILVDGILIRAATFESRPDGWLDGGYVEWTIPGTGNIERRAILSHGGNEIAVMGASINTLEVGVEVTAYAGCDRTLETCNDKFHNVPNYGGFPMMPQKSPFDGDPVF